MLKQIIKVIPSLLLAILTCLSTGTIAPVAAAEIYQYTAFPPFLPRVVSPNILFVLDYSQSMVRPAYGDCSVDYQNCRYKFFNPNDDFDPDVTYSGYFDNNTKYNCTPGTGGGAQCTKNPTGDFDGDWLNWLAATQFDVLKKVVVGGDVTASPEQGNPTKLQSLLDNVSIPNAAPSNEKDHTAPAQSVPTYKEFYKVVEKQACLDNAPDALCDTTAPQRIPYNWIDPLAASATGVDFLWGKTISVDDQPMNRVLPFTFNYFGTDFTRITISENGYIKPTNVDENIIGDWSNDNIPNTAAPNNIIAPFWDDMRLSSDSSSFVSLHTVGTMPNRICVITFNNILPYSVTDIVNKAVSFQILLFEGDSQIVFQYKDIDGGLGTFGDNNSDKGLSSTIGLENATGTLGKKFYYGGWIDTNANGIVDVGEKPTVGLLENNLALHMTYGYKVFRMAPGSTYTDFRIAGTTDAAAYPVNIAITNTAKIDGVCPSGFYINKYRNECYNHVTEGLLQEFRDGELAGLLGFRIGIMALNAENGGTVVKHFNQKDTTGWASLMNSTRSQIPLAEAPIAEALHMAQGYFRQVKTDYDLGLNVSSSWSNTGTSASCGSTGTNYDPFCFQSAAQKVPCAKSYALLVSAGNYSHDFGQNIYGDAEIADKTPYSDAVALTIGEIDSTRKKSKAFAGLLDNVAYKMHTTDLRTDIVDLSADIAGSQTVGLYAVNTFGAGSGSGTSVMKRTALYGGFKDADGDGVYNPGEDVNGNCILDTGEDTNSNGIIDGAEDDCTHPKTYFEASGGGDLRAKIVSAVTDILKNSASGTSVSVLSTSAGGEGALYQAYFYPARIENEQEDRKWPGFLRAFLLDTYQQLRDDYSGGAANDHTLNTANDRVAKMFLDPDSSEVKVNLYATPGKLAEPPPDPTATVSMDNVASIWEGGAQLAKRDKSGRRIYLWHDANNDGLIANGDFSTFTGETMELVDSNATALRPYLRAIDDAEAANIINYTRGSEIAGYRSRCITVPGASTETGCLSSGQRVWPLGDIIFSTPTLVGTPAEKYNQIYGDQSYFAFYNKYKNRRQVVYLGSNDGMLHAFNAGSFNPTTISFADNPATGNGWSSPLPGLGDEIWSFIPHENLPHLAWLACNGTTTDPTTCGDSEYTHVYYVDHRPRVTDARIFPPDDTHPNGWGSVLILPLRLGGGAIEVDLNGDGDTLDAGEKSFQSAYYAFDVTDAEKPPKLLWRFTAPDLGFTTSYPAIVRVDDNGATAGGTVKWFMVVGSGPQNSIDVRDYGMTADTTQAGKVFVVDLVSGTLAHQHTFVAANAIMGDPIAVDVNIDFTTDVVYIGSAISVTSGRVFRINTANRWDDSAKKYFGETDPAQWTYSDFFDPEYPAGSSPDPDTGKDMGPLLVSPSISMDRYGHLWVYFGSGRLKNTNDLTNSHQQRFYGIKDACWEDTNSSKCVADKENMPDPNNPANTISTTNAPYKLAALYNSSAANVTTATDTSTQVVAATTDIACLGAATPGRCSYQGMVANIQKYSKGWYVDLDNPSGASERVLARSSVIGGLVLFTAYQPAGDICSIFGNSSLYAVYYETGTASNSAVVEGNEGKETKTIGGVALELVRPKIDLGQGMPTSVGIAIGETVSGFVQKSTGEIIRIEATPALNVRSSISGWRETTGNTGSAGVETIYEHIIK